MHKTKVVFFGTGEFAAFILQGLIDFPFLDIVLVVTQPDQPVGRKQILTPPLTKTLAKNNHIKVIQPETLKNFEFPIKSFDLSIVIEYGRIIPERLLDIPNYKTINIHPSKLPLHRGPTPIQAAILSGETKTATTIMQMDATMDTGPILLQKEISIERDDTFTTLREKLMPLSLEALLEVLPQYIDGSLRTRAQNNTEATYCHILTREDGHIDWHKTTEQVYNQYRALHPWPGVWSLWNEKRIKFLEIKPDAETLPPGTVQIKNNNIYIGTENGTVQIVSLQIEGKPKMEAKVFAHGYKNFDGAHLS